MEPGKNNKISRKIFILTLAAVVVVISAAVSVPLIRSFDFSSDVFDSDKISLVKCDFRQNADVLETPENVEYYYIDDSNKTLKQKDEKPIEGDTLIFSSKQIFIGNIKSTDDKSKRMSISINRMTGAIVIGVKSVGTKAVVHRTGNCYEI